MSNRLFWFCLTMLVIAGMFVGSLGSFLDSSRAESFQSALWGQYWDKNGPAIQQIGADMVALTTYHRDSLRYPLQSCGHFSYHVSQVETKSPDYLVTASLQAFADELEKMIVPCYRRDEVTLAKEIIKAAAYLYQAYNRSLVLMDEGAATPA